MENYFKIDNFHKNRKSIIHINKIIIILCLLINLINKINLAFNRKLETPEEIEKNLFKYMNQPYILDETIIIDNYKFEIESITPIFIYKNSTLENNNNSLIHLNEPKMTLFYNVILSFQNDYNKIIYFYENKDMINIKITLNINYEYFNYIQLIEDNSYIFSYDFLDNHFNSSTSMKLNYIDKYSIFKDNFSFDMLKEKLYLFHLKKMKEIFNYYPVSDGYYYYDLITNYMLKAGIFEIENPGSNYSSAGTKILQVKYEKFNKEDFIICSFVNFTILFSYNLESKVDRSTKTKNSFCFFEQISIKNKNINFKYNNQTLNCNDLELFLMKNVTEKSQIIIDIYT